MEDITNMTLRDYLRVLFRQKAIIVTTFITVMVAVIIGVQFKTPKYEAHVKMLVSAEKQTEAAYYRDLAYSNNNEVALTQSEIMHANPVIERAVKAVGLYSRPLNYEKNFSSLLKKPFIIAGSWITNFRMRKYPAQQKQGLLFRSAVEDLKANIKVEPIRDTNLFTLSVTDYSPIGAAVLANVVSRSYVIFDLEQQLTELQTKYGEKHQTVLQLKTAIENMEKNLTGEPVSNLEAIGPASVKIIEQAQIPTRPNGLSRIKTVILTFFMSIFLSIMLAFLFEYLDQTFRYPIDIENTLSLPFLGSIPPKANLQAYQTVSEQIYLLAKDSGLKTIALTSALPNEGTTTTVANMGRFLGRKDGHKVLIIDANFRNPGMRKIFGFAEGPGLVDVIEEKSPLEKSLHIVTPNLAVLTSGKTELNPIILLNSVKMSEILKEVAHKYEIVLIDAPQLRDYKDAALLANHVNAYVLLVDEGKTRRQVVQNAILSLQNKKANILGVILNNRNYVIPKAIYDRI